jgi:hypothetical protein
MDDKPDLAALAVTVQDVQDDLFRAGGDRFVRRLAPVEHAIRAHRCDETRDSNPTETGALDSLADDLAAMRDAFARSKGADTDGLFDLLDEAVTTLRAHHCPEVDRDALVAWLDAEITEHERAAQRYGIPESGARARALRDVRTRLAGQ